MLKNFSNRFDNKVSEVAHIILALYSADIYEQQRHELVQEYGQEVLNAAEDMVGSIIKRLI